MSSGGSHPTSPDQDSDAQVRRSLRLCADDYGISPAVNRAIRDLVARGRINATSVMVVAPSFSLAQALALEAVATPGTAIGLHFTLTAPFQPRTRGFRPLAPGGHFQSLPRVFAAGLLHRLHVDALAAEAAAQLEAFRTAFGRLPDFVDGHQHVQLLPQVGDALLAVMKRSAPQAWIRQCGRPTALTRRARDPKGLLLDLLSGRLRARSAAMGVSTNPAFAGTYNFRREAGHGVDTGYEALFASFLDALPDGGLVMCHPGFVDAELRRLDELTIMREREYSFFAGERFLPLLAKHGYALA
jgi:chitin disaccharide deacetylase